MANVLEQMLKVTKPIIGMVHLLALPGAPRYDAKIGIKGNIRWARRDAKILEENGVDAIMFCNEADIPYPKQVGPETVASMTRIVSEVVQKIGIPYGISVLFDFFATIAIAKATDARFVRVILTGAFSGDYGIMDTFGPELLRYRRYIDAEGIKLFANISGEFGVPIASRPIEMCAKGAVLVGMTDALIVQGPMTGMETDVEHIQKVKRIVPDVPVLVGSGATKKNVAKMLQYADGVIVGTSLKIDGNTWNPVDARRVREFMEVVRESR